MNLNFGHLKFDLKVLKNHLKQDFKDDWFKDPVLFQDRFDYGSIIKYFDDNIVNNIGVYKPVKRKLFNVPKKGSTLRYSLETCFYDRIAYHAFGLSIIPYFDTLISRRVLNHRFDAKSFNSKKNRYLFLNSINQWKKFDAFVRLGAPEKTILITDLLNYFENIKIETLRNTLLDCLKNISATAQEKSKINYCIESLCSCLTEWAYNSDKGLPQSRDVSSFLANIYMLPVDKEMLKRGYDYYRYMDDVKIICSDKFEAREALQVLIIELRKIGLSVNPRKTEIIEPETKEHEEFMQRESYLLEVIDSMLQSKKRPIVAFAFLKVKEELERLIKEKDFQSREFRFYIYRICQIALCEDITKPEDFFTTITNGILENFIDIPEAMDQYYQYLTAVKLSKEILDRIQGFLLDRKVFIYEWQNYLIWKLLAFHKHYNQELVDYAKSVLQEDSANAAGAMIYLGVCGSLDDKVKIAKGFKNVKNFFHQRHALLGVQELEYQIIKEFVSPYVLKESFGIYRSFKQLKEPIYITPPEPVKYTQLINEASFYV